MADLFGGPTADDPHLTPKERKRLQRKAAAYPRGHAWAPGTGPEGETCGSCEHLVRLRYAKTYRKCDLARAKWTHGGASDIRAGDPACKFWEAKKP